MTYILVALIIFSITKAKILFLVLKREKVTDRVIARNLLLKKFVK